MRRDRGLFEQGKGTRGLPRNLGGPKCSIEQILVWVAIGGKTVNIRACIDLSKPERCRSDEEKGGPMVPLRGGNEAYREGTRAS